MTTLSVLLSGKPLSDLALEGVSFICDLTEMYCTGEIVIKDIDHIYTDQIKMGTPFIIKYKNDKGRIYENSVRTVNVEKIQDQLNDIVGVTKVYFVSEWKFNSTYKTLAYKGNYGQWITKLQRDLFGDKVNYSTFYTEDSPKQRYMISKRPQDFIQETMKYGRVDKLPVYLHTLPTNKVVLDGIYTLTRDMNPDILLYSGAIVQKNTSDSENTEITNLGNFNESYVMLSHNLQNHSESNSSAINYIFTNAHFKCSSDSHASPGCTIYSLENKNDQVEQESPKRVEYVGWEYTPDDAIAKVVREGFEEVISTFTLTATVTDNPIETLYPGKMVRVKFIDTPGKNKTTGDGIYMIKRAAYQWKRGFSSTTFQLIQAVLK